MTPAQRTRLYLPAWRRAFDANWRKGAGGVEIIPELPVNPWRDQVAEAAAQAAAKENRPPTPEDLRHAAVFVATNKWSSKALNNRETNRLVSLCKLLVDPLDLSATVAFQNPANADREALISRIKLHPAAYVAAIARGKFKVDDWTVLNDYQIRHLSWTLNHRTPVKPAATSPVPTTQTNPPSRRRNYYLQT